MLDKKLLVELQKYVEKHSSRIYFDLFESPSVVNREIIQQSISPNELEGFIKDNRQPTFSQLLFSFIDRKNDNDIDVYKRAGMDRRHFSKIRSNPNYKPRKNTAISLAFALELDIEETDNLLSSAGYSLSESDTFDLVIQFCLEKKIYSIQDVNQALDYFSLKPLAGVLE